MKLGMLMMPIHSPGRDIRITLREADVGEHVGDAAPAQRSMQLMAEEVMPRLNAAIGQA
ncbi:MAG: hypothetical protein ACK4F6_17750 [Hylemonella sp.]